MAIPKNYLKRRDLLFNPKISPATLCSVGREYLAQEFYSDALDFFGHAKDEEGIRAVKEVAMKLGDTFLLNRLERIDPKWVTKEDWEKAGAMASKRGMESMALYARNKVNPPEIKVDQPPPEEALAGL